jgi:hypothetical protein
MEDVGIERQSTEKSRDNLFTFTRYLLQYLLDLDFGFNRRMELEDSDVLFSRTLLRFGQTSRTINAHDQASRDGRIQCSAVPGLLNTQNSLHPRNDFMTRRIGRLVEIAIASGNVLLDRTLQR